MQGLEVVGAIALALAGAYPLVKFLTTVLAKPLGALGKSLGMDTFGAAGLVATLANNIPMWGMFKDMTPRGKVINAAFQVAAAFATRRSPRIHRRQRPQFIGPFIIGKIFAGILGIVVAPWLHPRQTTGIPRLPKTTHEAFRRIRACMCGCGKNQEFLIFLVEESHLWQIQA